MRRLIKQEINSIVEALDKATIASIVMISMIESLQILSIPIAAQTLVNLIAFGKLLQPTLTLSVMVLALMIALRTLNNMAKHYLQQKLKLAISLQPT